MSSDFKQLSISGQELATLKANNADLETSLQNATQKYNEELRRRQKFEGELNSLRQTNGQILREKNNQFEKNTLRSAELDNLRREHKRVKELRKSDAEIINKLQEDAKEHVKVYDELLKSYSALTRLVDDIQAGKIVKLCQDCTALEVQLTTAQSEKEDAERRVETLNQQIERERTSSGENYTQLRNNHLIACKDRDRHKQDLDQTNVDLAKEKEIVKQMVEASGKKDKLFQEKDSAFESKEAELARKTAEYNTLKQDFDAKCMEVTRLAELKDSELAALKSLIDRLIQEHEDSKRIACEELEEKHNKSFNKLAGEKARQEQELKDTIDKLTAEKSNAQEQIRSLMAMNGVPSPISPQEESPGGIFSDGKKRKLDHFEGSPESKSKKAWTQHAQRVGTIISNMMPEGSVDTHQAYYKIARCFALTSAVDAFSAYVNQGDGSCFCLATLLAVGVANASSVSDSYSICENCQETCQECCVRVQLQLGVVRFYLIHAQVEEGKEEAE
jgi:myosin heavy subunit